MLGLPEFVGPLTGGELGQAEAHADVVEDAAPAGGQVLDDATVGCDCGLAAGSGLRFTTAIGIPEGPESWLKRPNT